MPSYPVGPCFDYPNLQSQTIASTARSQVVHPRLTWQYHNYTSMTTFLRHVSTIYSNLTALYSIGQSVQVWYAFQNYMLHSEWFITDTLEVLILSLFERTCRQTGMLQLCPKILTYSL